MEGSLSEGSINSRFLWGGEGKGKGKQLSWGCLEQLLSYGATEADSTSLGKGNNMSFLQMLECAETRNPGCFQRHEKAAAEQQIPSLELESCVTNGEACCMNSRSEEEMKEKRKRKRGKSREEVEGQRMTHIAVERNRRRQMNDHLSTLRSLMPAASYVHRGDQASIIGGAIEFVKELEQLLQSLEAQKSMRKGDSDAAGVRLRVIERHANVKVECEWMPAGLLVKAIAELEEMRLSVLHLNITDSHSSLLCLSLNLKIEDDCKVRSADEIAGAVQHLFNSFVVTSNL